VNRLQSATQWLASAAKEATAAIPAGTWRASQPGKLTRPATITMAAYTGTRTVDVGPNGTAPVVTFTAAGTAYAQVGPQGVGETWALDQCSLSTSVGQLDNAQCAVFCGPAAIAPYQVAANLSGGGSQFGLGGVGLAVGDSVYAQWTGGTPGATAQLKVTGSRTVLVQQ